MEVERVVNSFGISYCCKKTGAQVKVIWFTGNVSINQKFIKTDGPYNIWEDGTRFFYIFNSDGSFEGTLCKKSNEE